jgi:hypothetical protein
VTTKPYDPTLKALVETEPEAWPALLGRPTGPTAVIDADIATVSGAADKVLRVSAELPYLMHLEFVSGHDVSALPRKLLVRNALLEDRHDLPVRSGVVLLRPEADSPQLSGRYERGFPGEDAYLTFRYQVLRIWQTCIGSAAEWPSGLAAIRPNRRGDSGGITWHNKADGTSSEPTPRAKTGTVGMGVVVHPIGAALLARVGNSTVSRSSVHERIFDLSGHSGRRTHGRTHGRTQRGRFDRSEKDAASSGRRGVWSPRRADCRADRTAE